MNIHERIRERRIVCGLSVEDIAAELGISRATVYRYESAEIKNMGIDKIEPLARVLATTPEYLMGWTDDPVNYDDPDLIAGMQGPVLDYFDGDVKKAVEFQKAVDSDAFREQLRPAGLSAYQEELPDDIVKLAIRINKLTQPSQAAVIALVNNLEIVDAQLTKEPKKEA